MVNSNANALGIIFPNSYDALVPELVSERLMASIPFAGRCWRPGCRRFESPSPCRRLAAEFFVQKLREVS